MTAALVRIEGTSAASPARRIAGFARLLRGRGFPVGIAESMDALRVLKSIGTGDAPGFKLSLRALLCTCEADWRRFDELFDGFWRRRGVQRLARVSGGPKPKRQTLAGDGPAAAAKPESAEPEGDAGGAAGGGLRRAGASHAESLAQADFRHLSNPEDLALVHDLAERLARRLRKRLTRRYRADKRGRVLDLRRVIHRSIATGGTPLTLAFRKRRLRPPRLVMLLDASGSMSQYSSFFLRFMHGVLDCFDDADAFVFHTRLVHLGDAMRERDPIKAGERLAIMSAGWAGGTRIGESLTAFNRHHGAGALNGRTIVVIVSDGYDTGPPELLAGALARIKKRAKRIVWLNPMMGWRGYQPVAQGMAAALAHIDLFAPAHNLRSLAALESQFARL